MPLTVHDFLSPCHAAETFPPWAWITTPELARLCGVSQQSVYNWRLRRTGPPSRQERSGRHFYRLAAVLSWIEKGARTEDEIIVAWINRRFPGVLDWARGQDQNESLSVTLEKVAEYLEGNKLVPRTRKPRQEHVAKYQSPIEEAAPCP